MNKMMQNVLGGLVGATALTITHQLLSRFDKDAPRLDIVGEEAVTKGAVKAGVEPPSGNTLTGLTLAGDIGANSGYYTMIGQGEDQNLVWRGLGYGVMAGIGALSLPAPMGLDDEPVTRTTKTKIMTMGLYVLGGLVTALALKALRKNA
ncbi:MAG: hypothetical protein ACTHMM_23805 [Agriterribacter sp.]